jgi:putative oxidoreductase
MKIVALVARILLGLIFFIFGLNGFLHFIPAGVPPGLAGQFMTAMFASHYSDLVFGVQLIGGILLLVNRFVPLALVLLAAEIANILVFHLTMLPAGFAPAIVATILWLIVAYDVRTAFRPLVASKESGNESVSVSAGVRGERS